MENSEKRITLINALIAVVAALENGTVDYDWKNVSHCNVGLVAQAITRTDKHGLFNDYLNEMAVKIKGKYGSERCPTWTQMVVEYCPLTGEPMTEIFKKLYAAGMHREDISHLEYLNSAQIMHNTSIDTKNTIETYYEEEVQGWWIFKEEVTVEKRRSVRYYEKRENLHAYLKSWIDILRRGNGGTGGAGVGARAGVIVIEGEEYEYRNSYQLEDLKKYFLDLEDYKAVAKVQNEINKLAE